jgi:hypothetical protein
MEHVRPSSTAPWILDDFRLTAHDLGRWNGACLGQFGLIEEPWLARYHYRTVMEDSSTEDWEFALNQQYLSASVRARHAQLVAECELFSRAIDALPHTIGHLDAQRRNLLLCDAAAGRREVVLIDWADCGIAPLGAELSALVGTSSLFFEWPPAQVRDLDQPVFASYLAGLAESGWIGDATQIRLGYVGWFAMYYGRAFPGFLRYWCTPDNRSFALQQFGLAEAELYMQWLPFLDYVLECVDEARRLIAAPTTA